MLLYFTKIFSFDTEKCYISTCHLPYGSVRGKAPGLRSILTIILARVSTALVFTFLISDAALPETGSVGHRRWRAA